MATFYNQATLSYGGGVTSSNVTAGELLGALVMTKTAITQSYSAGTGIAYAITITNSGASPLNSLSLTDDLGGYIFNTGTVYPLTYTDGSARLFINGAEFEVTVNPGPPLVISDIDIPAGQSAVLIYEAVANAYAPLGDGGQITNTATLGGAAVVESVSDSATVNALSTTSLTIAKALCPDVVTDNSELTYTFIIQNTGSAEAGADADIVLSDTFNPILSDITVTLNGAPFPATEYTYDETSGVFSTSPGAITVPAASYTRSPSGELIATPGVAVVKITGSV